MLNRKKTVYLDGVVQVHDSTRMNARIYAEVSYENTSKKLCNSIDPDCVWAVFDKSSTGIIAAFTDEICAQILSQRISGSRNAKLMLRNEVSVEIDKFKGHVLSAKKPFLIVLKNGSMVDGYGPEQDEWVLGISDVMIDEAEHTLTATFRDNFNILALEQAQIQWKNHERR